MPCCKMLDLIVIYSEISMNIIFMLRTMEEKSWRENVSYDELYIYILKNNTWFVSLLNN